MKNIAFLLIAVLLAACSNAYDDVAPGSYVAAERIETRAGATVSVQGTVSNGSEIATVSLVCEAWGIDHTYDRTPYHDRVFAYNYTLAVPADATFPQTLTITATCKNGLSTVRRIPITYLPDTTEPEAEDIDEDEDPVADYDGMYWSLAEENPDDYIDGFWHYMDRKDAFQYEGKLYAAATNTKLYITPRRSLETDVFGESPLVKGKLLNKRGYVKPITIAAPGYYGIYVDLKAHTFSLWPLDISATPYNGPLRMSGTGFAFGEWGLPDEDMTQTADYRYTWTTTLLGDYSGDYQYYFYSPDWAHVFRADNEGKWWFESASGSCIIFRPQYEGEVTVNFDTALPWAEVKRK